jgi:TRAP-type C4-dicarboxylate transport system permease large subunit
MAHGRDHRDLGQRGDDPAPSPSFVGFIPAIVLFGPLLFPIARAVGVHEVHYAMIIILAMGIGLFAPPFGVGYYAACAIGRVDPAQGIRPIWGYLLALLAGLFIRRDISMDLDRVLVII